MIVCPAIDLREGKCVQLVGGSYDNELVRLDNPVGVARDWVKKGFTSLHIVDLDRATSHGSNIEIVHEIVSLTSESNLSIRVGGGIRTHGDIDDVLSSGANSVVVGTKALSSHEWLLEAVAAHPGQLYVAVEVNERDVMVKGWQEVAPVGLDELIKQYENMDIAGIFVTAIHKEGRRQGTDRELFAHLANTSSHEIIASGGITTIDDIDYLETVGISQVVLGAAIYTDENLSRELQDRYSSADNDR